MARKRIEPVTVRNSRGSSLRTVATFAPITNVPKLNLQGAEKAASLQKALAGFQSQLSSFERDLDAKQDNIDKRNAEGQFFIDQMNIANAKVLDASESEDGKLDAFVSEEQAHKDAAERFNAQSYMWKTTYSTLQGENTASKEIAQLNQQMLQAAASGDLDALEAMRDAYKVKRGELFQSAQGNAFFTGGLTSKFREADQNFPKELASKITAVRTKKMTDEVAINASDIFGRARDGSLTRQEDAGQKVSEVHAKTQTLVATGLSDGATARTQLVELTIQAAENNGDHVQGGAYIDALLRASENKTLRRADGQPLRLTDAEQEKLKDAKDKLVEEFYSNRDRERKIQKEATDDFETELSNKIYTEYILKNKTLPPGKIVQIANELLKSEDFIGKGITPDFTKYRKEANTATIENSKARYAAMFPTQEAQAEHLVKARIAAEKKVRQERQKRFDEPNYKSRNAGQITNDIVQQFKLPTAQAEKIFTQVNTQLNQEAKSVFTAVRGVASESRIGSLFGADEWGKNPTAESNAFAARYNSIIAAIEENGNKIPGEENALDFTVAGTAIRIHKYAFSKTFEDIWPNDTYFEVLKKGVPTRAKYPNEENFKKAVSEWRSAPYGKKTGAPEYLHKLLKSTYQISASTPQDLKELLAQPDLGDVSDQSSVGDGTGSGTGSGTGANADPAATAELNNAIGADRTAQFIQSIPVEERSVSGADLTTSVRRGDSFIKELKPEHATTIVEAVRQLQREGAMPLNPSINSIEEFISDYFDVEMPVTGINPLWADEAAEQVIRLLEINSAEEAARQIQNVNISDEGVD